MNKKKINNDPYSIRLGILKPELEKRAHELEVPLPRLIKGVLRNYIKKVNKLNQPT